MLPSHHPFYDGEGWFSPNPVDTSSLCLSLTLLPWEAPCRPPKMSQQNGAPATHLSSQMGPQRGSGSPTVTRHVVSLGLQGLVSWLHHIREAGRGTINSFHISHEKTGPQERPMLTQDTFRMASQDLNPGSGRRLSLLQALRRRQWVDRIQPCPPRAHCHRQ